MWGAPKAEDIDVEVEELSGDHRAIGQNFLDAILRDAPLIAPGEEASAGLELANAMILSSYRGKTVEWPVDRDEYEELIGELQARSREKTRVREIIETDPNIK